MTGERDRYGILVDPAEQYQEFIPGLYDIEALVEEPASNVCSMISSLSERWVNVGEVLPYVAAKRSSDRATAAPGALHSLQYDLVRTGLSSAGPSVAQQPAPRDQLSS